MFEKFAANKIDDMAENLLESQKKPIVDGIRQWLVDFDIKQLPDAAEKPFDELLAMGAEQIYDFIYKAVKAYEPK